MLCAYERKEEKQEVTVCQVLDESGEQVAPTVPGNLAVKLPLPPGAFSGLYNDEEVEE